jgi:hypothetical protein
VCFKWFLIAWTVEYWIRVLHSHLLFSGGMPAVASILLI